MIVLMSHYNQSHREKAHLMRSIYVLHISPSHSAGSLCARHQTQEVACYKIKPHELMDNSACIMNDLIGRIGLAAHDRVLASF